MLIGLAHAPDYLAAARHALQVATLGEELVGHGSNEVFGITGTQTRQVVFIEADHVGLPI
ncbi:hypothetical protein [Herbaspirillum huttiense]|uniref:hypothetical protein n=1 Tax=Herbaspirillum huttiense TaxID=863372 RepID=UPI002176F074|nr:hypothetical protein [Herbaspirillum huttiense]UWE16342.1 hypothetical protein NY669_25265 [Herbaspirillum huttiense]